MIRRLLLMVLLSLLLTSLNGISVVSAEQGQEPSPAHLPHERVLEEAPLGVEGKRKQIVAAPPTQLLSVTLDCGMSGFYHCWTTVSGGTPPYTYQWNIRYGSISSYYDGSAWYSPNCSIEGYDFVNVRVMDSTGQSMYGFSDWLMC